MSGIEYPTSWTPERIQAHEAYLVAQRELLRVKDEVLQPAMDAYNAAEAEQKRLFEAYLATPH